MIKTILFSVIGLLVLVIAVIAVIAAQRPDTFRVQRTASIAAPPDKLFPLINDVRAFNSWSPYVLRDPQATGRYSGPPAGPGAHYDFDGKKSGSGSFEITAATPPSQVRMRLDMTKPFEVHNVVTFTLVPQGPATQATWAMEGPAPFLSKFMGVLFDMDKMVGADFEAGLANLKARAEKPS